MVYTEKMIFIKYNDTFSDDTETDNNEQFTFIKNYNNKVPGLTKIWSLQDDPNVATYHYIFIPGLNDPQTKNMNVTNDFDNNQLKIFNSIDIPRQSVEIYIYDMIMGILPNVTSIKLFLKEYIFPPLKFKFSGTIQEKQDVYEFPTLKNTRIDITKSEVILDELDVEGILSEEDRYLRRIKIVVGTYNLSNSQLHFNGFIEEFKNLKWVDINEPNISIKASNENDVFTFICESNGRFTYNNIWTGNELTDKTIFTLHLDATDVGRKCKSYLIVKTINN